MDDQQPPALKIQTVWPDGSTGEKNYPLALLSEFRVGRSTQCDHCVLDPARIVSNIHLLFWRDGEQWKVKDGDNRLSTHGCWLTLPGDEASKPLGWCALHGGETITIPARETQGPTVHVLFLGTDLDETLDPATVEKPRRKASFHWLSKNGVFFGLLGVAIALLIGFLVAFVDHGDKLTVREIGMGLGFLATTAANVAISIWGKKDGGNQS